MLWFDRSNTPLATKIQRAADYYRKKYNQAPTLVLVHPSMLDGIQVPVRDLNSGGELTVRPYRPVLPGHLWIGVEEKP
jgi:hypothetical protein